jgi:DtxR family Mn-dependent transcriptional regulator
MTEINSSTIVTERAEEYLEALYHLEESGRAPTVSSLSHSLSISPPSVSEMLQRLVEDGYLSSQGRGRYRLSKAGRNLGQRVVRRHRLLERLLVDVLEMDWGLAHDEACRLEHGMSPEMEESLDRRLGHPQTCPHGNPIPGEGGAVPEKLSTLAELAKGVNAIIVRIQEEERHLLRYLASLGILPGARVEVLEVGPFSATRLISVEGCRYSLGEDLLRKIAVRIDPLNLPIEG